MATTFGWISASKFKVPNLETDALTYNAGTAQDRIEKDVKTEIESNDGELDKLRQYTGTNADAIQWSSTYYLNNTNQKTLKAGVEKDNETISKECIQMVRDKIGPVAAFKIAIVIKRLPKTRSGKILRGTIRKIADSVEYKMPPTIDDPAILNEIKEDLIKNNILKSV